MMMMIFSGLKVLNDQIVHRECAGVLRQNCNDTRKPNIDYIPGACCFNKHFGIL